MHRAKTEFQEGLFTHRAKTESQEELVDFGAKQNEMMMDATGFEKALVCGGL